MFHIGRSCLYASSRPSLCFGRCGSVQASTKGAPRPRNCSRARPFRTAPLRPPFFRNRLQGMLVRMYIEFYRRYWLRCTSHCILCHLVWNVFLQWSLQRFFSRIYIRRINNRLPNSCWNTIRPIEVSPSGPFICKYHNRARFQPMKAAPSTQCIKHSHILPNATLHKKWLCPTVWEPLHPVKVQGNTFPWLQIQDLWKMPF